MKIRKFLAAVISLAMCVPLLPLEGVGKAAELVPSEDFPMSSAYVTVLESEDTSDTKTATTTKKATTTTKKSTTTTKKATTTTKKSTTTTKKSTTTTKKSTTTTKKTTTTTKKSTTTTKKTTTTTTTAPKTTESTTTTTAIPLMLGDIDNDKKITGSDATWILREYTLISGQSDGELTAAQRKACDVDKDGQITASDATVTLVYYTYVSSGGILDFEDYMKYGPIDMNQTTTTTTTTEPSTTQSNTTTTTARDDGSSTSNTETVTETGTTTTSPVSTTTTTTKPVYDDPYKVQEIKLSHYEVRLFEGGGDMPLVTMYPETALNKAEKWWSSNTNVATVNYEGWITAVGTGECTITVQSVDNPDVTAEIKVTVYKNMVSTTSTKATTTTTTAPSTTQSNTTTTTALDNGSSTSSNTETVTETGTTTTTTAPVSTTTTTTEPVYDDPYTVQDITLSFYEITLFEGSGDMPLVTMYPKTALNKAEKWWSSNKAVATVNHEGWITAVGPGKCTITVQSVDNPDVTAEVKVTVIEDKVTEIKLDRYELTLKVNKGDMPLVTMYPEQATNKAEIWWTNEPAVATVNSEGWIVGIAPGECIVSVRSVDSPDVIAEVKVTVTDEGMVKKIILDRYYIELEVGEGDMPLVTMLPEDAEDKTEIWWSSDASVALVNSHGWIVAQGPGECTVTVQSRSNPKIWTDVLVVVKEKK